MPLQVLSMLARYDQSIATPSHLVAAKYVLQYLQGTLEEEIVFSTTPNDDLQLFTNIDITHLSLLERHISWDPHWNQIMACSSCQFEIYSMDECTKQIEM